MSLSERLKQADRSLLIADAARVVDREVENKSGISGMAIKTGYKVVKKLRQGFIEDAINMLLDEFSVSLNPLYDEFLNQDSIATLAQYLPQNDQQASNALLSITDRRAERADNKVLTSTYQKLRGQAQKHVIAALPAVGALLDKYAPK